MCPDALFVRLCRRAGECPREDEHAGVDDDGCDVPPEHRVLLLGRSARESRPVAWTGRPAVREAKATNLPGRPPTFRSSTERLGPNPKTFPLTCRTETAHRCRFGLTTRVAQHGVHSADGAVVSPDEGAFGERCRVAAMGSTECRPRPSRFDWGSPSATALLTSSSSRSKGEPPGELDRPWSPPPEPVRWRRSALA